MYEYVALVAISVLFLLYTYIRGQIDWTGVFGSGLIGILAIIAFGYYVLAIVVFFVLGILVTKYKETEKKKLGVAERTRTIKNVFGNGGAAALFSLAGIVTQNPIFLVGYLASIAAACSDTFSSEIGQLYQRPRLITNMKEVPPGTNGGVSALGLLSSIIGAVAVACLALLIAHNLKMFIVCTVAAFIGCLFDSFLGATIENGKVDKHTVNFLATSFGGILGMILWTSF